MTEQRYEYRVAYTFNDTVPRGAGTFYGPTESLTGAKSRASSAIDSDAWGVKQGRPKGLERAWIERRPVGEWEEVEA